MSLFYKLLSVYSISRPRLSLISLTSQLPANLFLRKFRVRNWLVQLGMGYVHAWLVLVCRVLLGVFEVGIFEIFNHWVPLGRMRFQLNDPRHGDMVQTLRSPETACLLSELNLVLPQAVCGLGDHSFI